MHYWHLFGEYPKEIMASGILEKLGGKLRG